MTSKERVLRTIDRRPRDRISATFKGTPEVDAMVMKHFGLRDLEEIKNVFPVDNLHWPWRNLYPKGFDALRQEGDISYDIWRVGRKKVSYGSGTYEETIVSPLARAETVEEIENYNWPAVSELDFSNIPEDCDRYQDDALGGCRWTVFEEANYVRGFERFLTDLALREDIARAIIGKIGEFNNGYNSRLLEASGGRLGIMSTGDDFGSQISLLMSLEMWKKFFLPGIRKAYSWGKEKGLKIAMHSDGAIRTLLPYLVDAGLDVLDPVMPQARGMDLGALVREFGKDLSFHGTIDVQGLLPHGKPESVYAEVREQITRYGRDGGLFLAPSHMIQPDTPMENILALYNSVRDNGAFA